jgi:hypothetical protein
LATVPTGIGAKPTIPERTSSSAQKPGLERKDGQ